VQTIVSRVATANRIANLATGTRVPANPQAVWPDQTLQSAGGFETVARKTTTAIPDTNLIARQRWTTNACYILPRAPVIVRAVSLRRRGHSVQGNYTKNKAIQGVGPHNR